MNQFHFQFIVIITIGTFSSLILITNGQGTTNGTATALNCSANQTLAQSGQDCLTCDNPTASCPLINEQRCFCRTGYVRNTTNACILTADCPPAGTGSCYGNASIASMSSNCFSCDNYQSATCPLSTVSKCYCNNGYVLDQDNLRCVYPSDCPVFAPGTCRANQTFDTSGYDCVTCTNYQSSRECFRTFQSKCYCNIGFVRDVRTDRCIRSADCSNSSNDICRVNETLANSGYDCATCANPNAPCRLTEQRKCYCLTGYIRTANGACVQPQDCSRSPDLPAGASCRDPWSIGCNPRCVPTCRRRETGFFSPAQIFCRPSCDMCACPTGQVRNDNGECIPENQCRQYPYTFPNFRFRF